MDSGINKSNIAIYYSTISCVASLAVWIIYSFWKIYFHDGFDVQKYIVVISIAIIVGVYFAFYSKMRKNDFGGYMITQGTYKDIGLKIIAPGIVVPLILIYVYIVVVGNNLYQPNLVESDLIVGLAIAFISTAVAAGKFYDRNKFLRS